MVREKKLSVISFCTGMIGALLISVWTFTKKGISDNSQLIVSFWTIGMGTALLLIAFKKCIYNSTQCAVLYLAYLVRIAYMLLDIYGRDYITLLHSGSDTEAFWWEGQTLYYGTHQGPVVHRYACVINSFLRIWGDNRVCVQYGNIVFWVLSCFVLVRLCKHYAVSDHYRMWIYIIWGFLPTGIFLTSILLRESIEMFFGIWSFEHFIYWMEAEKSKNCIKAFIYALPAIILHSASIALWATYIIIIMFWNAKRQKFRLQLKCVIVFVISLVGIMFVFNSPLRDWMFGYLGDNVSLYTITHKSFDMAGSDYLVHMDCQSWTQFIPFTLLRMFYFLFSPLPTDARGVGDLIMFITDGLVLFLCTLYMVWNIWRRRTVRPYIEVPLLGEIMFAGIFAWGVRNAGTALRHRYLVWSIAMVGLCMSNKAISKKTPEIV